MIVQNHGPRRTFPTRIGDLYFVTGERREIADLAVVEEISHYPMVTIEDAQPALPALPSIRAGLSAEGFRGLTLMQLRVEARRLAITLPTGARKANVIAILEKEINT